MNSSFSPSVVVATLLAAITTSASAVEPTQTPYGPTPYLSFSDSPFNGLSFSYFHLENFEGTATPGYASTTGGQIVSRSVQTDSVDADGDGINTSGNAGQSWFSAGSTGKFTFVFSSAVLGSLPTHAGVVWTDVGTTSGSIGVTDVKFDAFNSGGGLIQSINAANLGDGLVDGNTAEDRFFGVYYSGGIARIEISVSNSVDWEVDHLQYGALTPVPEPEQWMLMALGIAAVAGAAQRIARPKRT